MNKPFVPRADLPQKGAGGLASRMRPTALIAMGLAGHRRVIQAVNRLSDDEFGAPSLLPDWSRSDVIAWVALKSKSHVYLMDGPTLGELRRQFPDDYDQLAMVRSEASQEAEHLRSTLAIAFHELEASWRRLTDHLWTSEGITTAGRRSMTEILARHLRDVEIHHVDLDVRYQPSDWPTEFVDLELAKRLGDLDRRADRAELLAWLLGRRPAPQLGLW